MRVIRGLAQSHVGDVRNGRTYMHAHARPFPAHPFHPILTASRLELDADITSVAILTDAIILRDLSLHLLDRISGLLRFPSAASTTTPARTAAATLIATSSTGALFKGRWVHRLLWLDRFRFLILLKLLPSRRDEVDV